MKERKKLLMLLILSAGPLFGADNCVIATSDGREIKTSRIEARENGDLDYLSPDGKRRNRITRGRYRYAQIPKPAAVTEADQKYREQQWKSAAALFRKAGNDYKHLGWQVYCIRMEADSLSHSGEKVQAEKLLTELHELQDSNPFQQRERQLADDFLTDLLIDRKQYDQAEIILDRQLRLSDPNLVFSAFFKKAVILQARGQLQQALRLFYQTALLFPGHPRRAEALYHTWNLMAELKDPGAAKIAEMLKRDYPDSTFTKQLSF